METITSLVASSRHDERAVLGTRPHRIREDGVGGSRRGKLPAADVDYIGTCLDHLQQRPSQVNLGTGHGRAVNHVLEYGSNQTAALWRNPLDSTSVSPKDHARDMGAVFGNWPALSPV
jgi:hypothetical protein